MKARELTGFVGCLLVLCTGCQSGPAESGQNETPARTDESTAAEMPRPAGAEYEGEAFEFTKVTEDIYHARGTGALSVGCNSAIIINDNDVLLVDSHISAAAGWALLEELKQITDKPVRYQVNTHFHFDHLHGNQIYPDSVEIIGHEFTRAQVVSGKSKSGRAYDSFVGTLPEQIEELSAQADAETDPAKKSELTAQLKHQRLHKEATDAVEPTPPTTTLSQRLTLHRGGREIQILFFGRAHTGGDVVVFLPEEKVLITGDMVTGGIPYMGDGYANEWVDTLEHLKALDFEVILGGHGVAVRDREHLEHLQDYMRDFWTKAGEAHAKGLSVEEGAASIDMRNHAEHFPQLVEVGVHPHSVARVYELIDGTGS